MLKHTLLATLLAAVTGSASAALKLDVYNPGEHAVFPVSSEIITGEHDALLIDAQFQRNDAQKLVEKIRATGKTLKTIYISHHDPDFYFGLDVLKAAFPQAHIVATPQTIAAIKATQEKKVAYWGPVLKENAPKQIVIPSALTGDHLTLEGHSIDVVGLNGATPDRTFVWVPALKAVMGGVQVSANIHVWMADTQSVASRQHWLADLDSIDKLKPVTVVPSHYAVNHDGSAPWSVQNVAFTRQYLQTFERYAQSSANSSTLVDAMKSAYPNLGEVSSLELGAKVIKGELSWP
ncbi:MULTISPECIES: MBL fold metallo-hydrolase [Dickeya]|uniref:Metallo-beta-lactamase superfamily protein PA0057 n=1 Tax=Dickeya aquatica TaxID=1401087 RepID=A0A375AA68_9GAMM|nr:MULTISPECIES: MBL fold metallo-hydrolase [Dickeya]SLM62988.1 Metallo-beta-lactamase superfamily protein PA0057 [Dickeya aquatica]